MKFMVKFINQVIEKTQNLILQILMGLNGSLLDIDLIKHILINLQLLTIFGIQFIIQLHYL